MKKVTLCTLKACYHFVNCTHVQTIKSSIMTDKVRINTTLSRHLWEEELKYLAEAEGKSRNKIIEEALQEHIIKKQYERFVLRP